MTFKGMPNLIMGKKSVPKTKVCNDSTDTHFWCRDVNHRLTGGFRALASRHC